MMKPDVKIVIGWSGNYQKQVAQVLRDKLTAYSKKGYPINVSLISDDCNTARVIAEKMSDYFSDSDYAFFLFDTIGKACTLKDTANKKEECKKFPPYCP